MKNDIKPPLVILLLKKLLSAGKNVYFAQYHTGKVPGMNLEKIKNVTFEFDPTYESDDLIEGEISISTQYDDKYKTQKYRQFLLSTSQDIQKFDSEYTLKNSDGDWWFVKKHNINEEHISSSTDFPLWATIIENGLKRGVIFYTQSKMPISAILKNTVDVKSKTSSTLKKIIISSQLGMRFEDVILEPAFEDYTLKKYKDGFMLIDIHFVPKDIDNN